MECWIGTWTIVFHRHLTPARCQTQHFVWPLPETIVDNTGSLRVGLDDWGKVTTLQKFSLVHCDADLAQRRAKAIQILPSTAMAKPLVSALSTAESEHGRPSWSLTYDGARRTRCRLPAIDGRSTVTVLPRGRRCRCMHGRRLSPAMEVHAGAGGRR